MIESPFAIFRLALFAIAGLTAVTGVLVWLNRPATGARTLAALLGFVTLWILSYATTSIVGTTATQHLVVLMYASIGGTIATLFLFSLEYTGREHLARAETVAILAIEPATVVALAVTADRHALLWTAVTTDTALFTGLDYVLGPAFWIHAAYSYALVLVATTLVVRSSWRQPTLYRKQAVALSLGICAPWVSNVFWLVTSTDVGPNPSTSTAVLGSLDTTPMGFAISGMALAWAVTRVGLSDVTPVARTTVVDDMKAGVFVIDREDRLLDVNRTGRRLLDLEGERVIGEPIEDVLSAYPVLYERYGDLSRASEEFSVETDDGRRHFVLEMSPLSDRRNRPIGRLATVHDVTEQKRRERELRRKNEQLESFAHVLSHDLRNPLNVAEGFVDIMAETGEARNVERVQRAHDRMGRIIDDVLELAREGQSVSDLEPIDLATVAGDAWKTVDTGPATLECRDSLSIEADESRLRRLFENLFRNSVEHAGGHVRVVVGGFGGDDPSLARERGFYVADDGPGIPADERSAVFEAGYATRDDGTGLGLSIVESIATAHGWEVRLTESEFGGARFEFAGVALWDDRAVGSEDTDDGPRSPATTAGGRPIASDEATTDRRAENAPIGVEDEPDVEERVDDGPDDSERASVTIDIDLEEAAKDP